MDERKLRRLRVALYSRGEGVILFSLWSGIELFLVYFSSSMFAATADTGAGEPTSWIYFIVLFGTFALMLGVGLGLNIYIGRAAMGFSHGKPVRHAPLIWCGIYSAFYILLLPIGLLLSLQSGYSLLNLISGVLDIFVIVIHIQIIIFSRRLKKAEA